MRERAALETWHRRWVYAVFAALWCTGALWLYLRYVRETEGGSASSMLLKIHGAAAMAFLVLFGTLLWGHVPAGWLQRRQRGSGILLVGAAVFLVLSSWSLYYSAEPVRSWASLSHSALGAALPIALASHVLGARSARKARKNPS